MEAICYEDKNLKSETDKIWSLKQEWMGRAQISVTTLPAGKAQGRVFAS